MKTKIRSLIIICVLGLTATLNGNATSAYRTSCSAGTEGGEKKAKCILINTDENTSALGDKTASFAFESKSENLNSRELTLNEVENAKIDYLKEAQLVTKMTVDKEEAKAIQKLVDEGKLPENK